MMKEMFCVSGQPARSSASTAELIPPWTGSYLELARKYSRLDGRSWCELIQYPKLGGKAYTVCQLMIHSSFVSSLMMPDSGVFGIIVIFVLKSWSSWKLPMFNHVPLILLHECDRKGFWNNYQKKKKSDKTRLKSKNQTNPKYIIMTRSLVQW